MIEDISLLFKALGFVSPWIILIILVLWRLEGAEEREREVRSRDTSEDTSRLGLDPASGPSDNELIGYFDGRLALRACDFHRGMVGGVELLFFNLTYLPYPDSVRDRQSLCCLYDRRDRETKGCENLAREEGLKTGVRVGRLMLYTDDSISPPMTREDFLDRCARVVKKLPSRPADEAPTEPAPAAPMSRCARCGVAITAQTAKRTGGLCRPCVGKSGQA